MPRKPKRTTAAAGSVATEPIDHAAKLEPLTLTIAEWEDISRNCDGTRFLGVTEIAGVHFHVDAVAVLYVPRYDRELRIYVPDIMAENEDEQTVVDRMLKYEEESGCEYRIVHLPGAPGKAFFIFITPYML